MDLIQHISKQQVSSDEEDRRAAVVSLAGLPLERSKPLLITALGDPSWRVRKEAVAALAAAASSADLVEDLVSLLRSHDNAGLRNSAVEVLCAISKGAIPTLSRYLHDSDQDVRKFIVDILGEIGARDSLPLLVEALRDPDQNVCAAAVENLGKLGGPTAYDHLVECLQRSDVMLRFAVLEALARIGKPVPLPVLLPLARDMFLRKPVFDCLGSKEHVEALPLLLEGLGQNRTIREAAAAAIVRIRNKLVSAEEKETFDREVMKLKGSDTVEGLITSLSTVESHMKGNLIEILGIIADERAAAILLREAASGPFSRQCIAALGSMGAATHSYVVSSFPAASETEKRVIAYACGELHVRDCGEVLWQGMRDGDPRLRAISAVSAGKTGQEGLVDEMAALLEDPAPEVRDAAVTALSTLAVSVHDILVELAGMYSDSVLPEKRRIAASLYSVLHDVDKVSLFAKDEDVSVRRTAIMALSRMPSEAGLNHLMMALADEDADVRVAAARSLGCRGDRAVVEPLLVALKDEDIWVRTEALKSLAWVGDAGVWDAVSACAGSNDPPVVIAALECAVAVDEPRAVELLKKALSHDDEEVVKVAIELLSPLDEAWITECRGRLMGHPHWDVRRAFIRTMSMALGKKARPYLEEALREEQDGLVRRLLQELVERMR